MEGHAEMDMSVMEGQPSEGTAKSHGSLSSALLPFRLVIRRTLVSSR